MENAVFEVRDQRVSYAMQSSLWPIPHLHSEIEIIYVQSGQARATVDKKVFPLKKGDFFITFPNQVHYYENSVVGEYHIIIFSADILFELKNLLFNNKLRSPVLNCDNLEQIIALTQNFIAQDGPYKETAWAGILNQIMAIIVTSAPLKPRIKTDNSSLVQILDYCNKNFTQSITLDSVANALHLNKYHVSHLLNQKTGIGFNAYINSLRISEACDLLLHTNKKTSDISEEVGFGSIRTFNRAFISVMNITPLKYRETLKHHIK